MVGGTDPTSGAGIHLDNRVLQTLGLHGFFAISAITAQNSHGVSLCSAVTGKPFDQQLECLQAEFAPRAIKAGLICDREQMRSVCSLQERFGCPLIQDPVMVSSSGGVMVGAETVRESVMQAADRITLLTPNIAEAQALAGMKIKCRADLVAASERILESGISSLLIKGGHLDGTASGDTGDTANECCDYFSDGDESFWIVSPRMQKGNAVRGTGCTLATAIAGAMALGHDLRDAIILARSVTGRNIGQRYQLGGMRFQACQSWPDHYRQLPTLRYTNPQKKKRTFARCDTDRLGIYPVVDSAEWVRRLLEAGVRTIQLRIKNAGKNTSDRHIETEIIQAVESASRVGARLFINDHWRLAIKRRAYGVHLGQEDIQSADLDRIAESGLRLGVSTHSHWEMAAAIDLDPGYIAIGPIHHTTSKVMPFAPQGPDKVRYWMEMLDGRWPLVAIGGIDLKRARTLKSTGVGSVAMISAITQAKSWRQATAELLDLWSD